MNVLLQLWTTQPLDGQVPSLTEEPAPTNCRELIYSICVTSSFSTLADYPIGMTKEEAAFEDSKLNLRKFGITDPRMVLKFLDEEFEEDKPDAEIVGVGLSLLKNLFDTETSMVCQYEDIPHTDKKYGPWVTEQIKVHGETAKALAQAIRITEELLKKCQIIS